MKIKCTIHHLSTIPDCIHSCPETNPSLQICASFEGDLALGQSGYQVWSEKPISLPTNYNQTDVQNEILPICDADGDNIFDFLPLQNIVIKAGDNHDGYFGFGNAENKTKLIDDGTINIVVENWKDLRPDINQPVSSSVGCN